MKCDFVKSRDEALELLEADLITIQFFAKICHENGWQFADAVPENGFSSENPNNKTAGTIVNPAIRLVYSKD